MGRVLNTKSVNSQSDNINYQLQLWNVALEMSRRPSRLSVLFPFFSQRMHYSLVSLVQSKMQSWGTWSVLRRSTSTSPERQQIYSLRDPRCSSLHIPSCRLVRPSLVRRDGKIASSCRTQIADCGGEHNVQPCWAPWRPEKK